MDCNSEPVISTVVCVAISGEYRLGVFVWYGKSYVVSKNISGAVLGMQEVRHM